MTQYSTVYLSHGGGPLPLLHDPGHQEMVQVLSSLSDLLIKPEAILVVSAHWEEERPTVTTAANPPLYYDYYGFPEESYSIQYPAPGAPLLAKKLHQLLHEKGFQPRQDAERGLDHGLFIPLKIIYPEAGIPCFQLSLVQGLRPDIHIALGKVLQDIPAENLLVVGSGFSFHNMRAFFQAPTPEGEAANIAFADWLHDTCTNTQLSEPAREQQLVNWADAPGARYCHPREEHLLPLHVCYGRAQKPAGHSIDLRIMGKKANMFFW